MNTFPLSIITPTGKIFEGTVESLTAPALEGTLGILANHVPILTLLKQGTLRIQQNQNQQNFSITRGILEVNKLHQVLILADEASSTPKV